MKCIQGDGIFVANAANDLMFKTMMDEGREIGTGLRYWETIEVFDISIPIILTESTPDITDSNQYKKGLEGIRTASKIAQNLGNIPVCFGGSMKRIGVKLADSFGKCHLSIGDNLTVASTIEVITDALSKKDIYLADKMNFLATGATGYIGYMVVKWILENSNWKVYVKTLDNVRCKNLFKKYISNTDRFSYYDNFEEIADRVNEIQVGLLATHNRTSIPNNKILSKFSDDSLIIDVSIPNALDFKNTVEFRGEYLYGISTKVDDLNWVQTFNVQVDMDVDTIWPCFCELAIAINKGFKNLDLHTLLDVNWDNVKIVNSWAKELGVKYTYQTYTNS
ncbi:hypothetical protein [Nostoc sp. C117]|uniref:hypothetical protein n=1 Tax=Nostoc sp. C117 TaxID=3349875 RepID=UPI00370D780F